MKFMKDEAKNGRVAVISGGLGYLGRAISLKFLRVGWSVAVITRRPAEFPDELSVEEKGRLVVSVCDLSDETEVLRVAETILKKFGKVDVCIHAAAPPIVRKPILSQDFNDFNRQLAVGVYGGFNLFRSFAPKLSKGGALIGITSQAIEPDGGEASRYGSYVPAKYALRGLLRVLSAELKKQAIRVYAVSPGFMAGGLNGDLPKSFLAIALAKGEEMSVTSGEEVAEVIMGLVAENQIPTGSSITVPERQVSGL
jgi:NAD(P)-dependent dehydrogenase (short-subunit alcohol dehydrogenase family)